MPSVAAQEEKKYFFEITYIGDPANIDAMEIIKKGWEDIGIKVNIITMEWTTMWSHANFRESFPGATWDEGGYDMAFTGIGMGKWPNLYVSYHTDAQPGRKGGRNVALYSNGEVDKLTEEILKTTDDAARAEIVKRVEEIVHDELPMIYLYNIPAIKGIAKNLEVGEWSHFAGPGLYDGAYEFSFTDEEGGVMVWAGDQNPPDLNGHFTKTTVAVNNIYLVQGRLYRFTPVLGEYMPDLAESYEISENGLVYTFHIREGVTWHDGAIFDANDVKFTFDLLLNPEAGLTGHGTWSTFVKEVRMPDDYTIELEVKDVYAPAFYELVVLPIILPEHILGEVPAAELKMHPYNQKPIGTGPFKVVEWKTDEYIKYEAFDEFYRGRPKLDGIIFRVVPDKATGVAGLEAGEIHLIEQPIYRGAMISGYERLKEKDNLKFDLFARGGPQPQHFNLKHPALNNLNVRKAMAHAIDLNSIIIGPYKGLAKPAPTIVPPGMTAYYNEEIESYEYNLDTAKALMEEAGYNYESLEPPPEVGLSDYLYPVLGALVVGIILGVCVDRFATKR